MRKFNYLLKDYGPLKGFSVRNYSLPSWWSTQVQAQKKLQLGWAMLGPQFTVPFLIFLFDKNMNEFIPLYPSFSKPLQFFALTLSSFLMLKSTNDFLHYWALNTSISLSLSLGFCWYNQSISSHSLQQMDRRFNGPTTPSTSTDAAVAAAKSTPLPPQPNYNSRAVKVLFIFGLPLYIHI